MLERLVVHGYNITTQFEDDMTISSSTIMQYAAIFCLSGFTTLTFDLLT